MSDDFKMPSAALGDFVLYYRHEGAEPNVGIVTGTSNRTLTLWVIAPGYGGVERFSVHHLNDPKVADFPDWKEFGFWAHRPAGKEAILAERVAALEKRLAEGGKGNR